jgi:hypothetical protein
MAASDPCSSPGSLEEVIRAHLASWDEPHVELAIHGHGDASAIAAALAAFCRRELGAGVRGALFYQSSIGAVAGLELADGRRVVVKAHQPNRSLAELEEISQLQGQAARGEPFAAEERVLAGACFAYSVAYTARCAHAEGLSDRTRSGTFGALIALHGEGLLEL